VCKIACSVVATNNGPGAILRTLWSLEAADGVRKIALAVLACGEALARDLAHPTTAFEAVVSMQEI